MRPGGPDRRLAKPEPGRRTSSPGAARRAGQRLSGQVRSEDLRQRQSSAKKKSRDGSQIPLESCSEPWLPQRGIFLLVIADPWIGWTPEQ